MIIRAKKSLASMHNERNFSALDKRIKENKKIFVKNKWQGNYSSFDRES